MLKNLSPRLSSTTPCTSYVWRSVHSAIEYRYTCSNTHGSSSYEMDPEPLRSALLKHSESILSSPRGNAPLSQKLIVSTSCVKPANVRRDSWLSATNTAAASK